MSKKYEKKGFIAEEALRGYFLNTGYFVVRSIPLNYKNYNVTDIDLWLYIKASSISMERTCVDVKCKRTPQAMERVLWVKGLKGILGVERAIVATTDNRKETRDFGKDNGIMVFHGDFLRRVINAFSPKTRMTEEELFIALSTPCVIDSQINWQHWYKNLKAILINRLNFNGCNELLHAIKLLLSEYLGTGKSSDISVRLLYIAIAYFLISLDYVSRTVTSLDVDTRREWLTNKLRYGEAGLERTEEILVIAERFLADSEKANLFPRSELKNEFERQMKDYPAEILGEHFAKLESLKNLFNLAKKFEGQAYVRLLIRPESCSSDMKAVLGLLCDFLKIDRKKII
jgi:hypothetical protein